ncbi:hypothetical protein T01_2949 [Trichinella spiralis]|uniref:Uncharacterized protein n=1 Tax=Trichinella spiralis TaxID=6334 RepID=A0A0V1BXT8_TRISP|nr:hypothetical protein T01_2949 [Trichinella spiralis]
MKTIHSDFCESSLDESGGETFHNSDHYGKNLQMVKSRIERHISHGITVQRTQTTKSKNNEDTANRRILQDRERTTVVRLLKSNKMIFVVGSWYLRKRTLLESHNKYRIPDMHFGCENATGKARIGESGCRTAAESQKI